MFEESSWYIVNLLKLLWHYGLNPLRMYMWVEDVLDKFMRYVGPLPGKRWERGGREKVRNPLPSCGNTGEIIPSPLRKESPVAPLSAANHFSTGGKRSREALSSSNSKNEEAAVEMRVRRGVCHRSGTWVPKRIQCITAPKVLSLGRMSKRIMKAQVYLGAYRLG